MTSEKHGECINGVMPNVGCPIADGYKQTQILLCYPHETKERKEKLVKINKET